MTTSTKQAPMTDARIEVIKERVQTFVENGVINHDNVICDMLSLLTDRVIMDREIQRLRSALQEEAIKQAAIEADYYVVTLGTAVTVGGFDFIIGEHPATDEESAHLIATEVVP